MINKKKSPFGKFWKKLRKGTRNTINAVKEVGLKVELDSDSNEPLKVSMTDKESGLEGKFGFKSTQDGSKVKGSISYTDLKKSPDTEE